MANAITAALQGPPGALGISVATQSALAAQPPTNLSFIYGTIAFVQASGGSYWAWYPTGATIPSGATTQSGLGGTWVLLPMGNAFVGGGSAATVTGGTTYTLLATDLFVSLDTSNGSLATAQMVVPSFIGQKWTFWWKAYQIATPLPPKIIAPGSVLIMPYSGQPSSGTTGWTTSSNITTPGATWTVVWDGAELVTV